MTNKIHSNTPVIDHNSWQLNNILINATDPAAGAENQQRMEQVPTGRRSHENSGQQMPDTEVQVRNGEVVHVEQPNQKTQEEAQNIVQDLCRMTSTDSVRALCEMTTKDIVVTLNYMSKMNLRKAINILTAMMDMDKANIAANVISEMDVELSVKLLSDMETGVASTLLANMDQQTAVNFLQLMQTTTKTKIEIFYYMTPKKAAAILKHMDVGSATNIITMMFELEIGRTNVDIYVKKGFVFDILKIKYSLFHGMEPKFAAEILIHMGLKIAADIVCRGSESFVDILCEMNPIRAVNILCTIGDKYLIKSLNILCAISKKDASKAAEIVAAMAKTNTKATNAIFLNMGSMYAANIISEMDPEVATKVILAKVSNAIAEILSLMAPEKAAEILSLMAPEKAAAILGKMDKVMSKEIISKMRPAKAAAIDTKMKEAQSK